MYVEIDRFETWLVQKRYRASTRRKTLTETEFLIGRFLARASATHHVVVAPRLAWTARRLLAYQADGGRVGADFTSWLAELAASPPKGTKRKKTAVSIKTSEWARLFPVVEAEDTLEAAATLVMLETGLRVGDVFRVQRARLAEALATDTGFELEVKGGKRREMLIAFAPDAWQRLADVWARLAPSAKRFDAALCPNSVADVRYDCAARRMQRALKRYARAAKVSGRIFTHRIRRTVLVQALNATGDIQKVQQLAGHASPLITMRYTDEPRLDGVTDLLDSLRAQRKKRKG